MDLEGTARWRWASSEGRLVAMVTPKREREVMAVVEMYWFLILFIYFSYPK